MPNLQMLEENTRMAREFKPMPKHEMEALAQSLSSRNKLALDLYFQHHTDHYPA
jgi:hypothetical protein